MIPSVKLKYCLTMSDSGTWGDDADGATGVPVLRSTEIGLDGSIDPREPALRSLNSHERTRTRLFEGDILVVRSSGSDLHLGKAGYVNARSAGLSFSNFLQRLRFHPAYNSRFAWHFLNSANAKQQIRKLSSTTTGLQNLSASLISELEIPTPSLAQQRQIAEFLDAETAKLTRIENRSQRLTRLLDERESALTRDCFTFHMQEGVSRLPLRRAVRRWIDYRGATPLKTSSGIPLVTAKNIKDGRIDLEASREYIAADSYADWMRRGLLEADDILLTTEAPLGQVAMVSDTSIALAQRIIVLRAERHVCWPEWLYWYLRSPQGRSELELRATGSTALGIKADRLRGVPIPLPILSEAAQRLGQLSTGVTQIESLRRQLTKQRTLVAERRQALITAAVTGQFDVSTASGRNVTEGVSA
ncbi:restriction endonuclease subunit S [Streptomyces griseoaurantiacus]|uniref:restriction endonuclease subunit S n=1 Tax=Streptomyces griseoaurantiacus TaxID=68213 RepID=UPI0036A819BC